MRNFLLNIFFYVFTFGIAGTIWVKSFFRGYDSMMPVIRTWCKTTLWMTRRLLKAEIEFRGLENIPKEGPLLIVSKHQSELDVICHGCVHPDIAIVAMKELERYPFFGRVLRALEFVVVAVDQGPQGRTEATIEGTRKAFAKGRPMLIYPEGTLMSVGAKERYRRGATNIYDAIPCTAVPVAMSLGVVWPRREWKKNVGQRAVIEFMEPIPPGMPADTFHAEIERRIEARSWELIEETAPPDLLEKARDRRDRAAANDD